MSCSLLAAAGRCPRDDTVQRQQQQQHVKMPWLAGLVAVTVLAVVGARDAAVGGVGAGCGGGPRGRRLLQDAASASPSPSAGARRPPRPQRSQAALWPCQGQLSSALLCPPPADGGNGLAGMETLPLDTVEQDCILFPNRYYDIEAIPSASELVTAASNRVPGERDCCRACHAQPNCSVWQWCPAQGGCSIRGVDVSFPYQGCQLVQVTGFSPYGQGNLTSISGAGVPFIAGGWRARARARAGRRLPCSGRGTGPAVAGAGALG